MRGDNGLNGARLKIGDSKSCGKGFLKESRVISDSSGVGCAFSG